MTETAHLLLTAGTGPAECRIAVSRLVDEIVREAGSAGCATEATIGYEPDRHGPVSAIVVVTGSAAQQVAGSFEGTVKFTFASPVRPTHKRKNWFVGVCKIDDPDLEEADVVPDLADVRFETFRAGGPGGQHQNTTDSAVRAIHVPTGLVSFSREERSQHRNKATAVRRLGSMLAMLREERVAGTRKEIGMLHKRLERGNEVRHFK